jgi:hypothetical protein
MSNDLRDTTGRIFWRDGQILASRDLRGGMDSEERQRRLHNRYLHATWGIAIGFRVDLQPDEATALLSPGRPGFPLPRAPASGYFRQCLMRAAIAARQSHFRPSAMLPILAAIPHRSSGSMPLNFRWVCTCLSRAPRRS